MKTKKKHNALRFIVFTLIALVLLDILGRYISIYAVNGLLFWRTADFYSEPKNSLDAVMIGSSSTYSYWDATTAWEEQGITVYPFSTAQQPFSADRFIIEECRKYQPDSTYLINLNMALVEEITPARIHFLSDVMPPSVTRHKLIQYLCGIAGYDKLGQQVEYYMPVFAMHSRWKRVSWPFTKDSGHGCKGASVDPQFINGVSDVTRDLNFLDGREPVPDSVMNEVDMLLEYLEENDVKAAFLLSPASLSPDTIVQMNTICDVIRDRGYTVYNALENYKETLLDPTKDYFDFAHTNVEGAHKYTVWLSKKLAKDFGFADKRGLPGYDSWNEAVKFYDRIVILRQLI